MAKKSSTVSTSAPKKKRRRRGNKSKAIREYIAQNPNASTSEIVAGLRAQRIKVTSQFVSTIKSKANGDSKPAAQSTANGTTSPYEQMKKAGELFSEAMELVMKAGAKEAQGLVEMAGKMVQRIREKS